MNFRTESPKNVALVSKTLLKSVLVRSINGFSYASLKEAENQKLVQQLFLNTASTCTPMNNGGL